LEIWEYASSTLHPSAIVPAVDESWSLVHSSAAQKLDNQVLMGGIQDEFATVEKIATVPGRFKHVDAGEFMRPVKVVWQDSDSLELLSMGIS
jgi:hypothetical protein